METNKRIFLLGMSGIGMQGLAVVLKKLGHDVYGWDDGKHLKNLKKIGINYQETLLEQTDYLVFSSGIKSSHSIMQAAKNANIPCINRTDFWINHVELNPGKILIAAAHGKTGTTSMLAYILGMKSYIIGGVVKGYEFPAAHEKSEFTVIETDESDGSFIKWQANYKILLNFDYEHMEFFETEENARNYYLEYANDENCKYLVIQYDCKKELEIKDRENIITFGSKQEYPKADFQYHDIEYLPNGLKFKINEKIFELPLIGSHSVSNFTAVYALCNKLGISDEEIAAKAKTFPGTRKRMQKIMEKNKQAIFLDYGHHPEEVNAVLTAFKKHTNKNADVVLEPHKYSRIAYTWNEWPEMLKGHNVYVTEMFTAGEEVIDGINTQSFIQLLTDNGINAQYLENFEDYSPTNDTICFSAGQLSGYLDDIQDQHDQK